MKASNQRVFHYHADANALGGVLQRPYQQVIHSHASISLAPAGGHGSARHEGFRIDHVLSVKAAHTHVAGAEDEGPDGPWTSLVTAVVEDVNILEVVTADRIVAQLSVKHPKVGYVPTASAAGSQFVNLCVHGQPIKPQLNLNVLNVQQPKDQPEVSFHRHPEMLQTALRQSEAITGATDAPAWLKFRYGGLDPKKGPAERDYLQCSLVDKVECAAPSTSYGHVVHIPDFGDLILGELTVDSGTFRLTMLRAEMGCIAQGTTTLSTAASNGRTFP
jgi:hypothetical protein